MPKIPEASTNGKPKSDIPNQLKPFLSLGINLEWNDDGDNPQAWGDCPICTRGGRFSVAIKNGLWDCKKCGKSGNPHTLLEHLWIEFSDNTEFSDVEKLGKERNLKPDSLVEWEVVKSTLNGKWVVPAYNADQMMRQIYSMTRVEGKNRMLPTSTLSHQIFGRVQGQDTIIICEGIWDAISLKEALKENGVLEYDVIATPGCNVFKPEWCHIFEGKDVIIMFDNDYPKEGRTQTSAMSGNAKITGILCSSKTPPNTVSYLKWGEKGYNPSLKDGFDVGDALCQQL